MTEITSFGFVDEYVKNVASDSANLCYMNRTEPSYSNRAVVKNNTYDDPYNITKTPVMGTYCDSKIFQQHDKIKL